MEKTKTKTFTPNRVVRNDGWEDGRINSWTDWRAEEWRDGWMDGQTDPYVISDEDNQMFEV